MENKPVYKELQVGKKHLTAFSIVFMILSAIAIVGSIVLFICSAINLGNEQKVKFVICLVFGIIVGISGLAGLIFSILTFFTSRALINTDGSVKDDNRAMGKGNVDLCPKCGRVLKQGEKFCSACGEAVESVNKCSKCGKQNAKETEFCVNCGNKLK